MEKKDKFIYDYYSIIPVKLSLDGLAILLPDKQLCIQLLQHFFPDIEKGSDDEFDSAYNYYKINDIPLNFLSSFFYDFSLGFGYFKPLYEQTLKAKIQLTNILIYSYCFANVNQYNFKKNKDKADVFPRNWREIFKTINFSKRKYLYQSKNEEYSEFNYIVVHYIPDDEYGNSRLVSFEKFYNRDVCINRIYESEYTYSYVITDDWSIRNFFKENSFYSIEEFILFFFDAKSNEEYVLKRNSKEIGILTKIVNNEFSCAYIKKIIKDPKWYTLYHKDYEFDFYHEEDIYHYDVEYKWVYLDGRDFLFKSYKY